MNLEDCKKLCLENCSCVAYANLDMRGGGSGCLLWFSNLVYMRKFSQWGQDIYVRLPASKLGTQFYLIDFFLFMPFVSSFPFPCFISLLLLQY